MRQGDRETAISIEAKTEKNSERQRARKNFTLTRSDELESLEAPLAVRVEGDGDEVLTRHEIHPGGRELVAAESEGQRRRRRLRIMEGVC